MGFGAMLVRRFSRLLNEPWRAGTGGSGRRELGEAGERIARDWLRARAVKVLHRNFRAPGGGEVDIVAREGQVLLFVEVKTRSEGGRGRPLDAVDADKQRLIEKGAREWLRLLGRRDIPWRFDVIEVVLAEGERPRVHRVENAW